VCIFFGYSFFILHCLLSTVFKIELYCADVEHEAVPGSFFVLTTGRIRLTFANDSTIQVTAFLSSVPLLNQVKNKKNNFLFGSHSLEEQMRKRPINTEEKKSRSHAMATRSSKTANPPTAETSKKPRLEHEQQVTSEEVKTETKTSEEVKTETKTEEKRDPQAPTSEAKAEVQTEEEEDTTKKEAAAERPWQVVNQLLGGSGLKGIATLVFQYFGVLDFLMGEQHLSFEARTDMDVLLGRLVSSRRDYLQVMPVFCGPGNALVERMTALQWPTTQLHDPCAKYPDIRPFLDPPQTRIVAPPNWITIYKQRDLEKNLSRVLTQVSGDWYSLNVRFRQPLTVVYPRGTTFVDAADYKLAAPVMKRRLVYFSLPHMPTLDAWQDLRALVDREMLAYLESARIKYEEFMLAHPIPLWWNSCKVRPVQE